VEKNVSNRPKMTAEKRAQVDLLKALAEMVQTLTALLETFNEALEAELGDAEEEE
jgi:hypothetical protein